MPWTLRILHVDLGLATGDATLIVARNPPLIRTALIDGGGLGSANRLHARIGVEIAGANLNVMVATHYDRDHARGLTNLLSRAAARYAATRVYDQGEANPVSFKRKRDGTVSATVGAGDAIFQGYKAAVGGRLRPTARVLPDAGLLSQLATQAGYLRPDWLIGTDVLWDGVAGGAPANAPTLTCVSANSWVQQAGGGANVLMASGLLNVEDERNGRSLAFLLRFGNFKYYVGGDLRSWQESGEVFNGAVAPPAVRARSLMTYLNPTNDNAGRVHAMKTSHHGSHDSSSAAFLTRLRPRAVFISCGTDNQYGHPHQEVVDALENIPCRYYLTGEPDFGHPNLNAHPNVVIAGVWRQNQPNPNAHGDVALDVSQAQSVNNPVQFTVSCTAPAAGSNVTGDPAFNYMPPTPVVHNY